MRAVNPAEVDVEIVSPTDDALDASHHTALPAIVGAQSQPGGTVADSGPLNPVAARCELRVDLPIATFPIDPDHRQIHALVQIHPRTVDLGPRTVPCMALDTNVWRERVTRPG